MRYRRGHLVAALAAAALTGFAGCGEEAAEQQGEQIQQEAEEAGQAVEQEAQEAGEGVEQEAQDAQEQGEQGD